MLLFVPLIFLNILISIEGISLIEIAEASQKLFDTIDIPEDESDFYEENTCQVNYFPSMKDLDMTAFTGDWYEISRSITKKPIFSSSTWRFQATDEPETLAFFFMGRLENGRCFLPISGEITEEVSEPGKVHLLYDGLKSKVKEELRVIFNDFGSVIVLYGCQKMTDKGACYKDSVFVTVLSKKPTLSADQQVKAFNAIRSVCVDPSIFIKQNTSGICDLNESDTWKDVIQGKDWPPCEKPAGCTITCPPCCKEDSDSCITCECNQLNEDSHSGCLPSSPCPANCKTVQNSDGCPKCECPDEILLSPMAAPQISNDEISRVQPIEGKELCPTTCRTYRQEKQLFCNCTNVEICRKKAPQKNCQGSQEYYHFDPSTDTCHAYLGTCEDNFNSFTTVKECMNTCADICTLPPDKGSCNGNIEKIYYNRVLGHCTTFLYGGCGGNENLYDSKPDCQRRCPQKFQEDKNEMHDICKLPSERGTCENNQLRYYYDVESETCVRFVYGSCGGNENNFMTIGACKAKCSKATNYQTECVSETSVSCHASGCTKKLDDNGCSICDCPGGASVLEVSVSCFYSILLLYCIN